MRRLRAFWIRLRGMFASGGAGAELEAELASHLQMHMEDNLRAGMSPEQARREAVIKLGGVEQAKQAYRERSTLPLLEELLGDARYALRQLRRSPGFAIAVIGTLSLGLGATAAMFTVVDRVLLKPLPYERPGRLIEIKEAGKDGRSAFGATFLDLRDWTNRNSTLQSIAFHTSDKPVCFLEGSTGVVQANAPHISANLFATLGVRPAMGRNFLELAGEGSVRPEDAQEIILSDVVWRSVFGADPRIVGASVKLNGSSYRVLGVMPRGFTFPFGELKPVVWTPIVLTDADQKRTSYGTPDYTVIARLKPGATLAAAEADLKVIQAESAKQYTDPYKRDQVSSIQLQKYADSLLGGDVRKSLLALLGASAVLWLIACVNVTSLLLARTTARRWEIAVRAALGASRWRIVRQLLVEGLVLSASASLLGAGLAALTVRLFARALATQFNSAGKITLSLPAIGILFGLTIMTALIASLWPAVAAARTSIEPSLRQGGAQSGAAKAHHRMHALLVVAQIAMSLTLLVGCGLLLRTIYVLRHVPLGFRTDHVIVANMTIPAYRFAGKDMTTELYQPLVERVKHLPGVQSAALMTEVPLGKTFQMLFSLGIEGNSAIDIRHRQLTAQFRAVGPEMQKVFGFRMLRGRFFNDGDTAASQPVVVVNRAFAKAYTGEGDPEKILGESLLGYSAKRRSIVVGVLDDERQVSVADQSQPEIEVCIPQITPDSGFYQSAEGRAMDIAVRTDRPSASIIPELRELMRNASPELSSSDFTTMDQVVEDSYGSQQLVARLLEIFGGSALLLCVAGIYGLLGYLVSQRARELGLRMALGAQRGQIMWLVMRQAAWMLLAGSAIGWLLAYVASLLLRTILYGVKPHDPWTMTTVSLALLAAGLAAAYLPARRAAAIDPMQALRSE